MKGRRQIIYGLLSDPEGCPVAVEVFEGNTGDPTTVATQIDKLRHRFGLTRVVLVGDRGMITQARIREDLSRIPGLEYITALRSPAIRKLAEAEAIQMSLFDHQDFCEITHPDYPGERLVVCRNPALAEERARKRADLLGATERSLAHIQAATARDNRPLRGKDKIGIRVGKVLDKYKVGKHFVLDINEDRFSFTRDEQRIAQETALDGLYVIRTSLGAADLPAPDVVGAYKGLSRAEDAFRYHNMDLEVRPIRHRKEERVRAHLLLCMLAYYLDWHMRRALAPMLFSDDHGPGRGAEAQPGGARPTLPPSQTQKPGQNGPTTASRYTASRPSSPTWPP